MPPPVEEPLAHLLSLCSPREPLDYPTLVTPTTTEGVHSLYRVLEERMGAGGVVGDPALKKLLHATEKAFADRSLLNDENKSLVKQKDKRRVRQNTKVKVINQGNAKIMSYEDIAEAVRERTAAAGAKEPKKPTVTKRKAVTKSSAKERCPIAAEMTAGTSEIEMAGLAKYCTVFAV